MTHYVTVPNFPYVCKQVILTAIAGWSITVNWVTSSKQACFRSPLLPLPSPHHPSSLPFPFLLYPTYSTLSHPTLPSLNQCRASRTLDVAGMNHNLEVLGSPPGSALHARALHTCMQSVRVRQIGTNFNWGSTSGRYILEPNSHEVYVLFIRSLLCTRALNRRNTVI